MMIGRLGIGDEPVALQRRRKEHVGPDATLPVELRILQLGVHPRLTVHEIDGFLKRRHSRAGEGRPEPRPGVQALDLGEREVVHQPVMA